MRTRPLFVGWLLARFSKLRFPKLALLTALLFGLDLLVPDVVPLADEILLGLATALLASWKRERAAREPRAA